MKYLQEMHEDYMNKLTQFKVKMLHGFQENRHCHLHPFLDFLKIPESDSEQIFRGEEL